MERLHRLQNVRMTERSGWNKYDFICNFRADGDRTGKYILGGEELTLNDRGESIISYADYAIALVDEIEKGDHIQQRISVVRA